MPLSPGDKLGPYEVLSPLGAGGMGEVYKARDTRLDRTVAIKVVPEHIAQRDDSLARFEREARAVASLNHPNIRTLHDMSPGYMVMELIDGETLASRIEKGPLPLDQVLNTATQIADALDRAHRAGVTHRDIKPQNIMLTRDGVKVLDFGLAKSSSKPGPTEATLTKVLTTEGTVMGTPQYMAPEQFEGHWARTTPQFTLKLGNNLSSAWQSQLTNASSDWNSPGAFGATTTPLLTAIVAGQSNKRCAMVAGTAQVCNGSYGNNGWLGLASINITGGVHITQGSAKMNDTYFNTATYNNPNEKLHVMCQEVAHTFGLDHQSTDGSSQNSCMDYFSNTGANANSTLSTRPNKHDFDVLNTIYAHLDSTTTVSQSTAASSKADVDINDDPNSWGKLVSQSNNGRSATYERFNDNGSKTVTHVFWAAEATEKCPSCDHRYDGSH